MLRVSCFPLPLFFTKSHTSCLSALHLVAFSFNQPAKHENIFLHFHRFFMHKLKMLSIISVISAGHEIVLGTSAVRMCGGFVCLFVYVVQKMTHTHIASNCLQTQIQLSPPSSFQFLQTVFLFFLFHFFLLT